MVNHPNRSKKNALVTKLKSLLRGASSDLIISLASGRSGIAIFPSAREVHADPYFASDCPDSASEEHWRKFGPWAALTLDIIDPKLYELPSDWIDEMTDLISSDESLAGAASAIDELLTLGLATKADAIRRKVLTSDLALAVENALAEIECLSTDTD